MIKTDNDAAAALLWQQLMRWCLMIFFYGMLAHGMIKFKTKLSINWYTIIVIAIPFYVFNRPFFAAPHIIPALSFSLFHACSRSFNSFHSIVLSYHTPQKMHFLLLLCIFLLLLRVCVFLLSLLFSLLFVFFFIN